MALHKLNWTPDEPVELLVLGERTGAGIGPFPVRILELSGKLVRLTADARVPAGAAVRLEWGGQLLLGQVLNPLPDGFWMEIHHILFEPAGLQWQKQGWQPG